MSVWMPVGPAVCAGLKGNVFGNANFLISKTSFFAMSGFSEDRAGWEDYEFHAKAAISGLEYVVVPEPLMLYRLHSQEQMSAVTDSLVNFDRVLRAYQQLFSEAGVTHHRVSERAVAQCSITGVQFVEFVNVGGVSQGVCTSLRVTVVSRDASVQPPSYLATDNIELVVNGNRVTSDQLAVSIVPPTGSTRTWTVSLLQNATTAVTASGSNVQLNISASISATATLRTDCGTVRAPGCAIPVCFHEDSHISYNGRVYGMKDFAKHSECVIPHVVTSDGVSIETSCGPRPLRLTPDHLVFSTRGLVAAGEIKVGDSLFGDEEQHRVCHVKKVVAEHGQKYFGLNCHKSVVLADGIKASTFGSLHTLPAMWMKYVGMTFGIERASRWGDSIVTFVRSF